LSILFILIIFLIFSDGILSFGFFAGNGIAGLNNKASTIDLLDYFWRLYIGLI